MRLRFFQFVFGFSILTFVPNVRAALGDFDASFGSDGQILQTESGVNLAPHGVLVDASDRIVVWATQYAADTKPVLYRYLEDGSLDTSFSTDGILEFDETAVFSVTDASPSDVHELSDGSLVILLQDNSGAPEGYYLAKVDQNGNFDSDFGTDGIATYDAIDATTEYVQNFIVTSDDNIVVSGNMVAALFIVGIDGATGEILSTFGDIGVGMTLSDLAVWGPDSLFVRAIAQDSDGKIYVTGDVSDAGESSLFTIRFLQTGEIDSAFGATSDGYTVTPWVAGYESPTAMVVDGNNQAVMVAITNDGADNSSTLFRYEEDGTYDADFGSGGYEEIDFVSGSDQVIDMAIGSSGWIYLASQCPSPDSSCLIRLTSSGSVDTDFGTAGLVTVLETPSIDDLPTGVALTSKGRIVVVTEYDDVETGIVVSRFLAEQSDLAVSLDASSTAVLTTDTVNLTLTLTNQGDFEATAIRLRAVTDNDVTLSNLSETCSESPDQGEFDCELGAPLAAGDSLIITFDYSGFNAGDLNLQVLAETAQDDSDANNNSASLSFAATAPVSTGDDDDDDDDDDTATASSSGGCQLQNLNASKKPTSIFLLSGLSLLLMRQRRRTSQ